MEPELARFESEQPNVTYTHVNIDEKDKPKNKELFESYFKGQSIPLTVLVDPDGEARQTWTGYKSYPELVGEIAKLEKEGSSSK